MLKLALEEAFNHKSNPCLAAKLEEMEKEDMDEADDKVDEAKKEMIKWKGKKKRIHDQKGKGAKVTIVSLIIRLRLKLKKMRKIKEEDVSDLDEILAELRRIR